MSTPAGVKNRRKYAVNRAIFCAFSVGHAFTWRVMIRMALSDDGLPSKRKIHELSPLAARFTFSARFLNILGKLVNITVAVISPAVRSAMPSDM